MTTTHISSKIDQLMFSRLFTPVKVVIAKRKNTNRAHKRKGKLM